MILTKANMQHFVGLDVSQEIANLCVIGGDVKEPAPQAFAWIKRKVTHAVPKSPYHSTLNFGY